jgi:hypothetical protein
MKTADLDYIDQERLSLIPPIHRAQHEFCFFLHDLMVGMLLRAEEGQVSTVNVHLDEGEALEFLMQSGRRDLAMRVTLNNASLALYADLLHFLCEALKALERRKFAVAFTLLRKPLKQNLMFATWMCADESDFFTQLERSPADHMEDKNLPPERRLSLMRQALQQTLDPTAFNAQLLHDILFDKNLANGLAPLFDKAAHLVTSRGRLMRTEELNLNFIFIDSTENELFAVLYWRLAYVCMYLVSLQIALYSRMQSVAEPYPKWVALISAGCFEALFGAREASIVKTLNRNLRDVLHCPHCGAKVRVTKQRAARFFISQNLLCRSCGLEHQFPLFWLLSRVDWSITPATEGLLQ